MLSQAEAGITKMRIKYRTICYAIFIILMLFHTANLIQASEITTDSYLLNSHHTGIATSENASTSSYDFRYTTTYQQGSNRDVATLSYSANSGWLNNTLYINNDSLTAEPTCDSNNLNLCTNQTSCTNAGGYWYNGVCNANAETVCDSNNLNLCTSSNCAAAGGYWYNNACNAVAQTPSAGDSGFPPGRIIDGVEKEIPKGITQKIRKSEKIELKVIEKNQSIKYYLELSEVGDSDVLIRIHIQENQTGEVIKTITGSAINKLEKELLSFRLNIGKEIKLDLTNDGYYDFHIKLLNLEKDIASIFIEPVYEKISEEEIKKIEIAQASETAPGLTKIYLIFIVNIVLIFLAGFFFLKQRYSIVYLKGRLKQLKTLKRKGEISKKTFESEKEKVTEKILQNIGPKDIVVLVIGILAIALPGFGSKLTGFTTSQATEIISNNPIKTALLAVLALIIILIIIYKSRIKEYLESRRNKYPKDSIKGIIKKKVYSEEGDYVGRVKDVILHKGKIHSIKIRLDKRKFRFRQKGIIVKHKSIKKIGHVIIIDKKVSHHLEKQLHQ